MQKPSLENALHSTTIFQTVISLEREKYYKSMKLGKSSEAYRYQLKTRKQKHQQLIPIPKNNLECKTMKTPVYIKEEEQIDEQEIMRLKTFFPS